MTGNNQNFLTSWANPTAIYDAFVKNLDRSAALLVNTIGGALTIPFEALETQINKTQMAFNKTVFEHLKPNFTAEVRFIK